MSKFSRNVALLFASLLPCGAHAAATTQNIVRADIGYSVGTGQDSVDVQGISASQDFKLKGFIGNATYTDKSLPIGATLHYGNFSQKPKDSAQVQGASGARTQKADANEFRGLVGYSTGTVIYGIGYRAKENKGSAQTTKTTGPILGILMGTPNESGDPLSFIGNLTLGTTKIASSSSQSKSKGIYCGLDFSVGYKINDSLGLNAGILMDYDSYDAHIKDQQGNDYGGQSQTTAISFYIGASFFP